MMTRLQKTTAANRLFIKFSNIPFGQIAGIKSIRFLRRTGTKAMPER
jgi:hypothetical protein